jgi:hypothetical protein
LFLRQGVFRFPPLLAETRASVVFFVCAGGFTAVFKNLLETKKSVPSDPVGFRKNQLNSVKIGRNPFDSKFEQ